MKETVFDGRVGMENRFDRSRNPNSVSLSVYATLKKSYFREFNSISSNDFPRTLYLGDVTPGWMSIISE
jgi:hypothetical protein